MNDPYKEGYEQGKAAGLKEGFEAGWKAAMQMIRDKEEQARKERRAMCGRILNGE